MLNEGLLDVDALLAPVSQEGMGDDFQPRLDSELYLALKDWRAEARATEREALQSGDDDQSPFQASSRRWREVVDGGARLLGDASKDLEVAGWVCEGLLRLDGFVGLAQGFELMARLVEEYWNAGLRPVADEDGEETRLAPLFGLFGRGAPGALIQPIKLVPLTDVIGAGPPVALWTVEIALAPAGQAEDAEARERLNARRSEQVERVTAAVRGASVDFIRRTAAGVETALEMLDRLMEAVATHAQVERFGSQAAEPLRSALRVLQTYAPAAFEKAADAVAEPELADPAGEAATTAPSRAPSGEPLTRAQAFDAVERAAAFFERTEPQSMIARSLREVVRRAKLPLADLLAELLPDVDQRGLFLQRAGIREETPAGYDTY